ncbi:MFS transporter [Gilvimarinus sp. F26214L]|uniref:MFS transporter n=1 Tax=Gilvimarinus sp. DZF01 TaxID=3461371 RepID=UPI004045893F
MQQVVTRRQAVNVGILTLAQGLYLITSVTAMTLSAVVGRQLASDPALATLPVALMMVGTLIATLPASLVMKKVGRRAGLMAGTLLGGVGGGLLCGFGIAGGDFLLFSAGNFLLGIYQAFAMYHRFAAAEVATDSFRSRAISLVMVGGVISAFLGPWNAQFSRSLYPEQPLLGPYAVATGLAALAVLLLIGLRVPRAGTEQAGGTARPLAQIAAARAVPVAMLIAAFAYAQMMLVMTATPLAMSEAGLQMDDIALVMQAHVLGMFVPSFFTGSLISRFGLVRIILLGVAILVASCASAMAGGSLAHFVIGLLLLGVGWNLLFIGASTLLTESHTPAERGLVQGLNDLAIFALVAIAALLSGVLLDRFGWASLNGLMLPLPLAAGTAILFLKRPRRLALKTGSPTG